MIIADTNVVSEFMKEQPDQKVSAWARSIAPADLTTSVIVVQEIEVGLGQLPLGRRRTTLEARWSAIMKGFEDSISAYDLSAAQATAAVVVNSLSIGRTMTLADAQIAGTCLAMGAELATRNLKDFEHIDNLSVCNPFT